ncbi:MAG: hypothetical protein M4579_005492 [Chaenotheca gracillima]|nr:MAG: hypothetical protein M4579_005492 [Chaenotheca gracillima]
MDDPYEPSAQDEQDDDMARHLTAENEHDSELPRRSPPKDFTHDYRPPSVCSIDDARLADERMHHPNTIEEHVTVRSVSPASSHQYRDELHPQQFPRQLYTDMARTALFPSTPSDAASTTSQRFSSTLHNPHRDSPPSSFIPLDRSLPAREVTDEVLDDAYVAFVLYCNPTVPLNADSAELRKGFRAPPKSDGKTFSTFTLLELIRKLENKEIKTWTQLAIQLGVEPPMPEKNQSTQKVQQYAVRLKRWMHAMHVDAFFEYCLGKTHSYYTQIPPLEAPYPDYGRDGVPVEEDLALRALHPESRPKRGRRKGEDKDSDLEKGLSPAKRPHLDTSVASSNMDSFGSTHSGLFPGSAIPSTSHTDDMDHYVHNHLDPWTAASTITPESLSTGQILTPHPNSAVPGGQHFRWRLNARDNTAPSTPHPNSSVTPGTPHPPDSAFDEPHSAITPSSSGSKVRSRRRHGPAVSSAWPGGGSSSTGKLRGRPPSNRSIRDGPFSTFPANPKAPGGPTIDMRASSPSASSQTGRDPDNDSVSHLQFTQRRTSTPSPPPQSVSQAHQQFLQGKPSGLHLQVPQRLGGPVQLATPTVLVNGETDHIEEARLGIKERRPAMPPFDFPGRILADEDESLSLHGMNRGAFDFGIKEFIHVFATRLLKAEMLGDDVSLDLKRAEKLSTKVILGLRHAERPDCFDPDNELQCFHECAAWLGLWPHEMGAMKDLRIRCTRSPAADSSQRQDGQENEAEGLNADKADGARPTTNVGEEVTYHITYSLNVGPLSAEVSIKESLPVEEPPSHFMSDTNDDASERRESELVNEDRTDEASWKERYLTLFNKHHAQQIELVRFKKGVLEAVF